MERYPEMRAGRFSVIADFEDEKQLELFHVQNTSGSARIELAPTIRHRRSGELAGQGNVLRFHSASPDDVLIINNDSATNWYLKRDWRDYDVLRLAVNAPRDGVSLILSIRAGARQAARVGRTAIPLQRGLNELRFDLAELGDHLPLDEVREIRLSLDVDRTLAGRTQTVMLDDMLLTRDRETIVGDPAARDGSLYVQRIGRRYRIGGSGQSELIFGNGQVVGWYDLVEDPHKLHNLVVGNSLGPMIEWGASSNADQAGRFPADDATVVRTELLEASAVRAVLASAWYTDRAGNREISRAQPDRRWVYTIYPTGHVFVQLQAALAGGTTEVVEGIPFSLGVAMADGAEGSKPLRTLQGGATSPGAAYAIIRASDRATLLWVPYAYGAMRFEEAPSERFDSGESKAAVVTARGASRSPKAAAQGGSMLCAASLFALRPMKSGDAERHPEISDTAAAYLSPPAMDPDDGPSPCLPAADRVPANLAADECRSWSGCFDRSDGAYHLLAEGNEVRFSIDGAAWKALAPAFVIHGSEARTAWVYVNHKLLEPTARDGFDRLIFQLRDPTPGPVLVEVLLEPR